MPDIDSPAKSAMILTNLPTEMLQEIILIHLRTVHHNLQTLNRQKALHEHVPRLNAPIRQPSSLWGISMNEIADGCEHPRLTLDKMSSPCSSDCEVVSMYGKQIWCKKVKSAVLDLLGTNQTVRDAVPAVLRLFLNEILEDYKNKYEEHEQIVERWGAAQLRARTIWCPWFWFPCIRRNLLLLGEDLCRSRERLLELQHIHTTITKLAASIPTSNSMAKSLEQICASRTPESNAQTLQRLVLEKIAQKEDSFANFLASRFERLGQYFLRCEIDYLMMGIRARERIAMFCSHLLPRNGAL
ncbi:MAG: hypothetical protein M1828_005570 [Chrysothrix sp. TS-e1954]|nr:MAG: hypothetical protein M1828_005570 [Chrysothrix sp. TS-e1954]